MSDSMSPKMKPGDLMRFLTPDRADEAEGVMWFGGASPVKLFYRRYSGPSPEVLMRALENLMIAYGGMASLYDFEDEVKEVDELIAEAEAEIATETKGGAK